jgi:ABC-type nitrate/sulfonate/bicarbonate transport system substrate-binding protein
MTKGLGIDKDVKYIGTGGIVQVVAALRSGATDATVVGMFSIIAKLKLAGKVQALAGTRDYLPKPWVENVVEARKDFISNKPDTVRRAVKAFLQAIEFIKANPEWSAGKIKSFERLSDEQATYLYKFYDFTKDGKISRQAVENVRDFLVQSKLISANAIPRVDDVYTSRFTD